jgi:hypothetical protein
MWQIIQSNAPDRPALEANEGTDPRAHRSPGGRWVLVHTDLNTARQYLARVQWQWQHVLWHRAPPLRLYQVGGQHLQW